MIFSLLMRIGAVLTAIILSMHVIPTQAQDDTLSEDEHLEPIEVNVTEPDVTAKQEQIETVPNTELTETDDDNNPNTDIDRNGCKRTARSRVWVDRLRADTHTRLCSTVSKVDSWFGRDKEFKGENFRGKVAVGFEHDEIDGIDPRLRVRIRTKLPNVSSRVDAFLGRVEEDSYISNTEVSQDRVSNVGLRSTNDDDDEWLVGLGYRSPTRDNDGWDLSVGAKLSSGISPYTRVTYRSIFQTSRDSVWKAEQTGFWRKQDGFGVSSNLDYTRFLNDDNILVLHGSVKHTEESEQWEWFTDATLHHSISDKRGISSTIYARGEEQNPVGLPEYGFTLTYIRPIMRDWIYVETGVDFRWEREFPGQSYQSAVRLGLQFEMLLGDYYGRRKRR